MTSLDFFALDRQTELRKKQRLRSLKNITDDQGVEINIGSKKYTSFASNDYLGMAQSDIAKDAACDAIEQYGVGAKSSRLISGNHPIYQKLENNLAQYKQTEAALVFGSGYLASIGVVTALAGKGDLIVADKLIHHCLLDGAKLSGAKLLRFRHNDLGHAKEILARQRHKHKNCIIISETIFSMDGDKSDTAKLLEIAEQNDAWLVTDDAHGFTKTEHKFESQYAKYNYVQLGTLSKAIGSYGGYVAASRNICDFILTKASTVIYSTALPVPAIAAANKILEYLLENNDAVRSLEANINLFAELTNLPNHHTAIFIVECVNIDQLNDVSQKLLDSGVYVGSIRPPTSKTPRLRISISASHSVDQIKKLAKMINLMTI